MTEKVWTEWFDMPATDKDPVPSWAEDHRFLLAGGKKGTITNQRFSDIHGVAFDAYCYAIPAELAWLAKNLKEWSWWGVIYGKINGYSREQWSRARRDLYRPPDLPVPRLGTE